MLEVIPCVGVGLGKKLFGHLFWQRKLGKENQEENATPKNTDYFTRVTLALPPKERKFSQPEASTICSKFRIKYYTLHRINNELRFKRTYEFRKYS